MRKHIADRFRGGSRVAVLRVRLFLLLLISAFLLSVAWLLFGTITQTVTLTGVSFPQEGVRKVIAEAGGSVQQVLVQVGDAVEKGDLLAIVPNSAAMEQLRSQPDDPALGTLYENTSVIRAPIAGVVSEIVSAKELVSKGDAVAVLIPVNEYMNQNEIRAYITSSVAYRLARGMRVQVSPSYAPREQYGYLEGFISQVDMLPMSSAQIHQELGGFEGLLHISENESIVEVRVTLLDNHDSRIEVPSMGTVCQMQVITGRYHPIESLRQ